MSIASLRMGSTAARTLCTARRRAVMLASSAMADVTCRRGLSSAPSESHSVGFIGLGKIGFAMANNMMKAGHSLTVFDLDPAAVDRLVAAGATAARSAVEAAASTSRLVTVLPNDAVLHQVVEEVKAALPAGSVHVGCSTVSPQAARAVAIAHAAHGSEYVSAPVFARPDGMALGQATIPISGPAEATARVKPLLEATSTGVFEFGQDVGAANVVKLGGNFLIASAIEAMAESMALAEANGVDRIAMMKMLNSTIFDCLIYKGYGQRVSERDHLPYPDAHFALELGLKDVSLVSQTAAASSVPMPFCSVLKDRYLSAQAAGWSELDWSSIGMKVSTDAGADISDDLARNLKGL